MSIQTAAIPANFNGAKPVIDPDNVAMLLIDHQSGLFQTVQDMPFTTLRRLASTLAKIASLAKIPVITTASVSQGPNGPLIPEIHQTAPHATYVARKGEINAWDNEDFVKAVKATGKKQLIVAGVVTEVCVAFPVLSAATPFPGFASTVSAVVLTVNVAAPATRDPSTTPVIRMKPGRSERFLKATLARTMMSKPRGFRAAKRKDIARPPTAHRDPPRPGPCRQWSSP